MTSQPWADDDRLLGELGQAVRGVRPTADWVARLGRGAFAWHGVDADLELASLVYDSALEPTVVAREDTAGPYRTVLFEAASGGVQLERTDDLVLGQLMPPGTAVVTLVSASGPVADAAVDDLGCFSFATLPAEPVRLRWRTPGSELVSDWFRL